MDSSTSAIRYFLITTAPIPKYLENPDPLIVITFPEPPESIFQIPFMTVWEKAVIALGIHEDPGWIQWRDLKESNPL